MTTEHLSAAQSATLRAAVDRIIPPDDHSGGGVEAGVFDYLRLQIGDGGDLTALTPAYAAGMDALDALAQSTEGAAFVDLGPSAQDAVLSYFEGRQPDFFTLLVETAQEGFYVSQAAQSMVGWQVMG